MSYRKKGIGVGLNWPPWVNRVNIDSITVVILNDLIFIEDYFLFTTRVVKRFWKRSLNDRFLIVFKNFFKLYQIKYLDNIFLALIKFDSNYSHMYCCFTFRETTVKNSFIDKSWIVHSFADQTNLFRVPLWIEYATLLMTGHLKLRI